MKQGSFQYIAALLWGAFSTLVVSAMLLGGCSHKEGAFFYGSLGLGEPKILVSSFATGAMSVQMYDLDGRLVKVVADLSAQNFNPRGLAPINFFEFAVAVDGVDQIIKLDMTGSVTPYITNTNLTGNIYQSRLSPESEIFVIESNTIESFSLAGSRVGNPRIATTVGGCTLSTPRGMDFTQQGYLAVVGTGNHRINIYNVTNGSASCVTSNSSLATNQPVAILAHSNGKLYVATLANDQIYEFNGDGSGTGTSIFSNLTVINNPTALLELPDGTILVASDGTNSVVRIDTLGNVLNAPFIQNQFTGFINDMALMPGGQ